MAPKLIHLHLQLLVSVVQKAIPQLVLVAKAKIAL
jgi:hypothetical protein